MSEIQALHAAIARLEERVATLEAQREHMADILFGLLDGTQRHYAALAVMYRFSEAEDSALQDFFRWAFIQQQTQALTTSSLRAAWNERMPLSLRDKLDPIIQARRLDGELQWLTSIVDADSQS